MASIPALATQYGPGCPAGELVLAAQPGGGWDFPAAGVLGGHYWAGRQLTGILLPSSPSVPCVFCACCHCRELLGICHA